jgi:hypothetical protein
VGHQKQLRRTKTGRTPHAEHGEHVREAGGGWGIKNDCAEPIGPMNGSG